MKKVSVVVTTVLALALIYVVFPALVFGEDIVLASLNTPADFNESFSAKKAVSELSVRKDEFYLDLSGVGEMISETTLCATGMFQAWVAHEFMGHQAMADAMSVRMDWFNGTPLGGSSGSKAYVWWPHTNDKAELRALAISGIAAGALNTEIMLQLPRNSFTMCSILWSVANEIAYPLKHLMSGGYGDFELYRLNGGNDKLFAGLSIGHSILTLARLRGFDPGLDIKVDGNTFIVAKKFEF